MKRLFSGVLAVSVAMAFGCSGGGDGAPADRSMSKFMFMKKIEAKPMAEEAKGLRLKDVQESGADRKDATTAGAQSQSRPVPYEPPIPRKIIYNVNLTVVVENTREALGKIASQIALLGGYIVSNETKKTDGSTTASVTVRVPADRLDVAMIGLRSLAKEIENESRNSQDVTQEYVDLDSSLRNEISLETELLVIQTEVRKRTGKASEVLEIFHEVSDVRGRINKLRGRIRYIDSMADMATISMSIFEPAPVKPITTANWQPGNMFLAAGQSFVDTGKGMIDWGIYFTIATLPFILFWLAVVAAIGLAVRWLYRKLMVYTGGF